jgi:hypothetical protein
VVPGLFSVQPSDAPSKAMVNAANALLASVSDEQRAAMMFPIDAHQ